MKDKSYTKHSKEEILREVQQIGNISLVSEGMVYQNQPYLLG